MSPSPHSRRDYYLLATIFIIICLRILFAGHIWLIDDEAYYWEWAQHLDWSYYDHPGMTAWLIAIGQKLLGPTVMAVRLFPLFSHLCSWFILWRLALEMFGRKAADITALLFLLVPIFSLGGFLMVPDSPMGFFWLMSLYVFWKIYKSDGEGPVSLWLGLGALTGLGLNSKFTTIILIGSIFMTMLAIAKLRKQFMHPAPWLGLATMIGFCFPIIIWNIQHGWPGFIYQFYERHNTNDGIQIGRWLGFLGSQAGFLSPVVWIAAGLVLLECVRQWRDERWRFVFCLSIPTLLVFYLQPLLSEFKPHWPAPGYMLLLVGMSELWLKGGAGMRSRSRAWARWGLGFLLFLNLLVFVPASYPVIPKLYRLVKSNPPWDYRWDFTNDLYNWDDLGREVLKRQQLEYQSTGQKPFLAGSRYQLASQVAFATQQQVWKFGPNREQADFIQRKDEMHKLFGHTALVVTNDRFQPDPMDTMNFAKCEDSQFVTFRGNEKSRTFHIWRCTDFQGPK